MTPSARPDVAATRPGPAASLLVAALVMLRRPCPRNTATARLLLERAAEHAALTPAEREACRELADDLDSERPAGPVAGRDAGASLERFNAKHDFAVPVPGTRRAPAAPNSPTS